MTPTEQARRSDSLFYGQVSRRELCDMIAHRESDLEEERRANGYLEKMAARVVYNSDDGKLPRICPKLLATRTDNGCLHCAFSLKAGELWACIYREGDEDAIQG